MKRLILPLAAVLTCAGGFWVWAHGWHEYSRYKESRALRQASVLLAKGDPDGASVSARQVLRLNPTNAAACRILADLAERSRSPSALDWVQRLARIEPAPANQLRLAACALRFERRPYPLANRVLRELETALDRAPAFHVLSAELALKSNRFADARAHFERAAMLEPLNPLHKLNLAVLDLQSTNSSIASAARESLGTLSTHTNLGQLALRWLTADDLRRNDLAGAESTSRRLVDHPRAQLEDRLQRLAILQQTSGKGAPLAEFTRLLRDVQASAGTNVSELFTVCEWMGNHGLADEGLVLAKSIKPELVQAQPMPLAVANLYLAKRDWPALEDFLSAQNWADMEFLRMALLARAAAGSQQSVVETTRWKAALRLASDRLWALNLLMGLAQQWGRDPQEVLWIVARGFPNERWALDELEKIYATAGNTRGLNLVSGERLHFNQDNPDATNANNFAATSMLLGINLPQAHAMARELYRRHPDDLILASTYAYSLHLQGRTAEGVSVLRVFEPGLSNAPSVALYYGVLLAAAGDAASDHYLALPDPARLLPEEKQLLAMAKARRPRL